MKNTTWGQIFSKELTDEEPATRKCLERVPEKLYDYKPHPKSMTMGNLVLTTAEIPRWIQVMAEGGEIDFATWKSFKPKNTAELVNHFDENMQAAKVALKDVSDDDIAKPFPLKNKGQVVASMSRQDFISSTINHLVHHRGQLSVYLRLNDIPVPAIYGPSADEGKMQDMLG